MLCLGMDSEVVAYARAALSIAGNRQLKPGQAVKQC